METTTSATSLLEDSVSNKSELSEQLWAIFTGPGLLFVCSIGSIVNTLSITVLLKKEMRSPMNVLLAGLQISDFFVVLSLVFLDGLYNTARWINPGSLILSYLDDWDHVISYSTWKWSWGCSVYLTVVLTIERYVAVCHPFKVSSFTTKHSLILCGVVAMISAVMNIPYFLERGVEYDSDKVEYIVKDTEFAETPFYIYYSSFGQLIISFLIPFTTLFVLNYKIHRQVRKAVAVRASMSSQESPPDNSLTFILFSIVATFFICNLFELMWSTFWAFEYTPSWVYIFILPFKTFFIAINSSANFFFYCAFGQKFRNELFKTFCFRRKQQRQRRSTAISTSTLNTSV